MKKSDFKNLIKESVKEALLEEGILSTIVAEVIKETRAGNNQIIESRQQNIEQEPIIDEVVTTKTPSALLEKRKKILDAIGKDSFNGVDLFEGTSPMRHGGSPDSQPEPNSPLSDIEPGDPGIDISSLIGNSKAWKQLITRGKNG
jgi:hypothetical protein